MNNDDLKELSKKIRTAIKLENPKARFMVFLFAGDPTNEITLRMTQTAKCNTIDKLGAIDSILNVLEEDGIDRKSLLAQMIKVGTAQKSKQSF